MEHGGISLNYFTPKKGRKNKIHQKKRQGFLLNESGPTNSVVHVLQRKEHLNITNLQESKIFHLFRPCALLPAAIPFTSKSNPVPFF